MDEAAERRLEEVMAEKQRQEEEQKRLTAAHRAERREFLTEYERVKQEVIRPVWEEYGQWLEGKGYTYRIEDSTGDDEYKQHIRLRIGTKERPMGNDLSYLGLQLSVMPLENRVFFSEGGLVSINPTPAEYFQIENVTKAVVSDRTRKVIEKIVARWQP